MRINISTKPSKIAYLVSRACSICDRTGPCEVCVDTRYTLHWLNHDEVMRDLHTITVIGSRRFGPPTEGILQSSRLYVVCIPRQADEAFLRRLFSFYGTVVSVRLAKDLWGKSLGSAFCRNVTALGSRRNTRVRPAIVQQQIANPAQPPGSPRTTRLNAANRRRLHVPMPSTICPLPRNPGAILVVTLP
jgi:hypothetical protein